MAVEGVTEMTGRLQTRQIHYRENLDEGQMSETPGALIREVLKVDDYRYIPEREMQRHAIGLAAAYDQTLHAFERIARDLTVRKARQPSWLLL